MSLTADSPLRSDDFGYVFVNCYILKAKIVKHVYCPIIIGSHFAVVALHPVPMVLKTLSKEVLAGCKIVFRQVFHTNFQAEKHRPWKMAEQLGAKCSKELFVIHVVSLVAGTEKSLWAVKERKFLINPGWIEAANYQW